MNKEDQKYEKVSEQEVIKLTGLSKPNCDSLPTTRAISIHWADGVSAWQWLKNTITQAPLATWRKNWYWLPEDGGQSGTQVRSEQSKDYSVEKRGMR